MGEVVEVEIRPRFPLFGGWKTKYTLGYNVPSYQLLFTAGNEYVLKIPFLDHVYDDMVVDKLTLKVVASIDTSMVVDLLSIMICLLLFLLVMPGPGESAHKNACKNPKPDGDN